MHSPLRYGPKRKETLLEVWNKKIYVCVIWRIFLPEQNNFLNREIYLRLYIYLYIADNLQLPSGLKWGENIEIVKNLG